MKKKLKKSLACLLAALLIFSAVPMSALADEADTPVSVTVETNAEKAAQDTEPDAEPKPEITAEPTATPEASTTPAAERGSIYAQQRLEVMEMQRIRQEQRAAEYAEKQQQQQNLSFAARLLNTIGNALCRQTLRDQQSATATTDRKQRRMQRRLKRALGQKEDYEQIFQ